MGKRFQEIKSIIVAGYGSVTRMFKSLVNNRSDISLQHLDPEYSSTDHKVYVDILEDALKPRGWWRKKTQPVRSIALSGGYGVGKSSILKEVKRRNKKRVVSISLATLGVTKDEPRSGNNPSAMTTTNRIQKEIVKQILYSESPNKMPGSQYHRIAKATFWRNARIAVITSIVLTTVFYLTGWLASLSSLLPVKLELWAAGCALFAAIWALSLWVLYESHNRLHIDKLTAGETALVLSKGVSTYFDEYLDEIVYFFETASKRDIVIFEDIDRFDDPGIFENLRSLNEILNGAKQLGGRNICFIYAMKDSIFELLEKKEEDDNMDTLYTNRTKFFSLIVPVVPFVSHTSARDLMDVLMGDIAGEVSDNLIDLTSRHIPDMRLMKNIRNEFIIFKRQVVAKEGLELPDDGLFAMIVYKNMHLADFEQIRLGKSNLDKLYQAYRNIINSEKLRLNSLISANDRAIHEATTPKGHGEKYGTAFLDDVTRTLRRMVVHGVRRPTVTYQYQGQTVDDNRIVSDEFWEEVSESHEAITVSYNSPYNGANSYDVAYDELQAIVGDPLDAETWKKSERKRLEQSNDEAQKDIDFLDCAGMNDLMDRPKFRQDDKSFETIAGEILGSGLAIELIRNGYIDRKYALHASIFHGNRVSPNAMNYIMQNVEPRRIDTAFQLTTNDVEKILKERPDVVDQVAAYNSSFLDYLLSTTKEKGNVLRVVKQLMRYGDNERSFIYAYLESGKKAEVFIKVLAAQWTGVFTMLTAEATPLSEKDRIRFMNVALRSAQADIGYVVHSDLKTFLESSYRQLSVFTSAKTTTNLSAVLSELLNHSEAKLDDIAPLGSAVRGATVGVGAYRITKENLLLAVNSQDHSLSLDDIKEIDDIVYNHVLDDLPAYLTAIGENTATISANDQFNAIIEDVLSANEASAEQVIKQAAPECRISTLSDVSEGAWLSLAKHHRFPLSLENVTAFTEKYGVDEHIAALLTEAKRVDTEGVTDNDTKVALAKVLLIASDTLSSAELRAELVSSLNLSSYIADEDIPTETGELVGWLIDKNIAADDAETFAHIASGDFDGLVFAISKSANFASFMTTAEIAPLDVGRITHDELVPTAVKNAIVDRFTEFTTGATSNGLYLVASYALKAGKQLPVSEIQRLATEGVEPELVVALLQSHLSSMTLADTTPILTALGDNYLELTERNGKHPRFIRNDAHRALGERLIEFGLASSLGDRGDLLQVNMRRAT